MTNTSLSRAPAERPVDRLPTGAFRSSALEVSGATCSCSLSSLIKCQNTPDNAPKHVCFRREQETGLSLFYPIEIGDRSAAPVSQWQSTAPVFRLVCNKFPVTEKKAPSETGFVGLRPPPGSRWKRPWLPRSGMPPPPPPNQGIIALICKDAVAIRTPNRTRRATRVSLR
jgi:hypothetical protein